VPTPAADDSAPPATQAGAREREAKAPTRRYRLNDEMKRILFELVLLSNECVRLENEKHALEGAKVKDMSEQGTRKTLYQKVCARRFGGPIARDADRGRARADRQRLPGWVDD
jgi:hypothetical protein